MFAIYHFLSENSAGIGPTSLIKDFAEGNCQVGDQVLVKWSLGKGKASRYVAKIVRFGATEEALSLPCAEFLKKLNKTGVAAKKRALSPAGKSSGKRPMMAEDILLQKAKQSTSACPTEAQESTAVKKLKNVNIRDMELETAEDKDAIIKQQAAKIERLQAAIALLEGLPALLQLMEKTNKPVPVDCQVLSYSGNATTSKVAIRKFPRCTSESGKKFTNEIMQSIYSKEYMMCHSVTGTNTSKPSLPSQDIADIIDAVIEKFPMESPKSIKGFIGGMLCNSGKIKNKTKSLDSIKKQEASLTVVEEEEEEEEEDQQQSS